MIAQTLLEVSQTGWWHQWIDLAGIKPLCHCSLVLSTNYFPVDTIKLLWHSQYGIKCFFVGVFVSFWITKLDNIPSFHIKNLGCVSQKHWKLKYITDPLLPMFSMISFSWCFKETQPCMFLPNLDVDCVPQYHIRHGKFCCSQSTKCLLSFHLLDFVVSYFAILLITYLPSLGIVKHTHTHTAKNNYNNNKNT